MLEITRATSRGELRHFNPSKIDGDLVAHLIELTAGGGADYTFECIGDVKVMRTALEACHNGRRESIIIGGASGRTDLPKMVDWYMKGLIEIDPMITHKLKRRAGTNS